MNGHNSQMLQLHKKKTQFQNKYSINADNIVFCLEWHLTLSKVSNIDFLKHVNMLEFRWLIVTKSDFTIQNERVSKYNFRKNKIIMAKYWRSVANELSTNIQDKKGPIPS